MLILKNLVSEVATNAATNTTLNYSSVQDKFWTALTNVHSARPTTNKTKLTALKNWYATLTTPSRTKLLASDKNFTSMNNDINTELAVTLTPAQSAQIFEMTRVNKILNNFTVTTSTYDTQLEVLQNLVISIAKKIATTPALDYTSAQDNFWTALTTLHAARPTTNKTKLIALKAWYTKLASPTRTKILASNKSIDGLNAEIDTDISILTGGPAAITTTTVVSNTETIKADLVKDLAAITKPSTLNALVNSGKSSTGVTYNTLNYLVQDSNLTNAFNNKINSFFTYDETLNVYLPNVATGVLSFIGSTELKALISLLKNPKLPKFLTEEQIKNFATHTLNTELFSANTTTKISTRCITLKGIIEKYSKSQKIPATTSTYIFNKIMRAISSAIINYKTLKTTAQKADRSACVSLFTSAKNGCSFTEAQKKSIDAAITVLKKM